VYQELKTINAEEIKRVIKLMEAANEQYESQEGDENVQPDILEETFPPCKRGDELNIADVLVTCNFIFRDA
jgi:ATP-dependent DNA helicase 2 subunit 1